MAQDKETSASREVGELAKGHLPSNPSCPNLPPLSQVSNWMEQEGSQSLQALTPKDESLETVEKAHVEFEDFFLQAAVHSQILGAGLEHMERAVEGAAGLGRRCRGGKVQENFWRQ